ncbi:MAG: hypothetical protein K8R92_00755 [Planctomycetes bacterium]|nr:hypothetical protein [Planctomycetota bacterium]
MATGEDMQPVKPGDPLRIGAGIWNDVESMVRDRRGGRAGLVSDGGDAGRDPSIVLIKNTTGSSMPRHGVVQLDGPIFTPASGDPNQDLLKRVVMKGKLPEPASGVGLFAVLLEPVQDGRVARASIDGLLGVYLNIGSAAHFSADIPHVQATPSSGAIGDDGLLESSYCGSADILWKESGTGKKLAIVRLGRQTHNFTFKAILTGYTSIGTNRWKSQWKDTALGSGGVWATDGAWTGGAGSGVNAIDYAYNGVERVQELDATKVGPGITVANFNGLTLQPIANETVVTMTRSWDGTAMRYSYSLPNALDGTCG